jgi:fluoroacetyl-CoA thioesterase
MSNDPTKPTDPYSLFATHYSPLPLPNMKPTLTPGARATWALVVPADKTVPHLFEGAPDLAAMPAVFATAFMIGLIEWTCMKVLEPHLEPGEGSVGIHVDVSHLAATLPGQTVTVEAECIRVEGRKITFKVLARDDLDKISEGTHQRMVVPWNRFNAQVNAKAAKAGVKGLEAS